MYWADSSAGCCSLVFVSPALSYPEGSALRRLSTNMWHGHNIPILEDGFGLAVSRVSSAIDCGHYKERRPQRVRCAAIKMRTSHPDCRATKVRSTDRRNSSKSPNDMLSVAGEQEVGRDRDPKCVATDKGNLDEHRDNSQPCENQGDQEYVVEHGPSLSSPQTIPAIR